MIHHGPTCLKGPRTKKRSAFRRQRTESKADASFRADLVARVRREIARGIYETPEKLEIAIERMLARMA
jgi:hypothetical protein